MFLSKYLKGPNFLPFNIQKYERDLMVEVSGDKGVHVSCSSLKTESRAFYFSKMHKGHKREIYRPILTLTN